jgi:hypothetical protein
VPEGLENPLAPARAKNRGQQQIQDEAKFWQEKITAGR